MYLKSFRDVFFGLFPNPFFVYLFFVAECFFQIYAKMVANIQQVYKDIGSLMIKIKLFRIFK